MSRVDVLVPCYNYGRYLRECVLSVLSQEGVDVRVLIIDDCSSDDSAEVGRRLAAEDARVEFHRHSINRGHIATYNEGLLEWAGGDYCMLLSADDLLTPGALGRAARVLDAHPEVSFVHGRVIPIDSGKPPREPDTTATACPYVVRPGEAWIEDMCRVCNNPIASPEVVVRTSLQKQVGGYRAELPHTGDLEMWLRLATRGSVGILDADQAFYRRHAQNMSSTLASTMLKDLAHRWAAFDALFTDQLPAGPERTRLRKLVSDGIAGRALAEAYRLFESAECDDCLGLLSLALTCSPDARHSKLYTRLKWKLRVGPALWSLFRQLVSVRRVATRY
jgi:glycosyltransferase involved in cell wall biosynthesis